MNHPRFNQFLTVSDQLNKNLGIASLLYGSLGLEVLTGVDMNPEDIDVLVPIEFTQERWADLKREIEVLGYILVDIREREFRNEDHKISFSYIEDLEEFAGIQVKDIEERMNGTIKYRLLNLHQYYAVYSKSIQDGYRVNTRNKKDGEKIEMIQGLMSL